MNMFEAVVRCLLKYVAFSGSARRAEYWWFALLNAIIGVILGTFQRATGNEFGVADVYSLLILLPGLAVTTRRLHDIGRSGWWQLLVMIPLVGIIVLLIWTCTRGEHGTNRFGTDPTDAAMAASFT